MRQPHPGKERLYKSFKDGNPRALHDLLEGERAGLYDYLLRMTGQVSKSTDTVDEVFQSLNEDTLESMASYTDLKICLYSTARRFISDIWNADTARLVNAVLEPGDAAKDQDDKTARTRNLFRLIDKSLRNLPGPERETALLGARSGFDWDEIAQIMGVGSAQAERRHGEAMARIERESPGVTSAVGPLAKLPPHAEPVRSSQRTVNLSMVMQGIKAKPAGLRSPFRIALIVLVVAVAVLLIVQPELFTRLLAAVRGLLSEERRSGL